MKLDHVTIRTLDLKATRDFFQSVFDLREGERPLAIHLTQQVPARSIFLLITDSIETAVLVAGGRKFRRSDCDALDPIARDLVARAAIALGRGRAFACCHGLRVFQCAAGFQVSASRSRGRPGSESPR